MSDLIALALGVLFLIVWVCAMIYWNSLTKAYDLGKEDHSRRKNRLVEYRGLARIAYSRGRRHSAYTGNAKLKNRLKGRRLTI